MSYTVSEKCYHMKKCPRCGKVTRMFNSQKYCNDCIPSRRREYWFEYYAKKIKPFNKSNQWKVQKDG